MKCCPSWVPSVSRGQPWEGRRHFSPFSSEKGTGLWNLESKTVRGGRACPLLSLVLTVCRGKLRPREGSRTVGQHEPRGRTRAAATQDREALPKEEAPSAWVTALSGPQFLRL